MPHDPSRYQRRSVRLRGFDYAADGTYFVTICVDGRQCLFGDIVDGEMRLNAFGEIVQEEWERSAAVRPTLRLDAFVVMPNHVHGLVSVVGEDVGAHSNAPPTGALLRAPTGHAPTRRQPRTIGAFVGGFKGAVTRRVNALRRTPGLAVWQRNYYEHIVRDEDDNYRIAAYVEDNPRNWYEDEYNPRRAGPN